MLNRLKAALGLEAEPIRQTFIGLEVPFPKAIDKNEALANFNYVLPVVEVQRCQDSMTHDYYLYKPACTAADWFIVYVETAKSLLTNETAVAWSQAGVAVLPATNPYAERFYEAGEKKSIKDRIALSQKPTNQQPWNWADLY